MLYRQHFWVGSGLHPVKQPGKQEEFSNEHIEPWPVSLRPLLLLRLGQPKLGIKCSGSGITSSLT